MHAVSASRSAGFSLIEMLIGLTILGTLMAIGMPSYNGWQLKTRAKSASEFYLDAFRTARMEAIKHNASSRLVLIENTTSGQFDWRVDICFPSAGTPCDKSSTNWSTETADALNVPGAAAPGVNYKSTFRSAALLPKASAMDIDLDPMGETSTYYTATGWINTSLGSNLRRIDLKPTGTGNGFPKVSVAVTLGGGAAVCLPEAAITDSRRCPS